MNELRGVPFVTYVLYLHGVEPQLASGLSPLCRLVIGVGVASFAGFAPKFVSVFAACLRPRVAVTMFRVPRKGQRN